MGFLSTIGNIGSSIISGVTGGAIDLAGQYAGNKLIGQPNSAKAYKYNEKAAKNAFKRSYGAYKTRYQDTMADMEAAGLNPILAAGSSGMSIGNNVQSQQGAYPLPHVYDPKASSSALDYARAGESETQSTKNVADAVKSVVETERTILEKAKIRAQTGKIRQEERKILVEMRNMRQQWQKIVAETHQAIKGSMLKVEQRKKVVQETRHLLLKVNQLKNISDIYGTSAGKYMQVVKEVMGSLGINLGIITGGKFRGR